MQLFSFCHSSTSYRVRIALELKGLQVEYRPVNLRAGEQRSAEYLELNPGGAVPLLISDDGQALSQSLAIIDFLDARYPGVQLLPADPVQRARVLEISNLIGCDIHPLNNVRVLGYLTKRLEISDNAHQEWYKHWVDLGLAAVEVLLNLHGDGPYCFGDQPTAADCCLIPQITNALRFGGDVEKYPRCMSIYQHCIENPAFQRAAPANQPDFVP
ncbi:maleylacetoacetate isomerase [Pseudomonas synxantha BG33R]|uniref:maleylacetoacetate isomerase n=1 Tax=Pseudomonas synxantha TaxID=47883 RepID=UPI00025FEECA|nr:maleylacetoacetate isomerase [Pseudomonas synxantha]EIK69676.1 maleylacetoacetate isomerase [Pseudomonas synxantha BG33R]